MQLLLLPVEPRINGAGVEGFVWVSDTLSILGEVEAPIMNSTSKSVVVPQDTLLVWTMNTKWFVQLGDVLSGGMDAQKIKIQS